MAPSDRRPRVPVAIEPAAVYPATGNTLPLLHQICLALRDLARDGSTAIIDLQAIPLAPGEEQRILDLLGRGELTAKLSALGDSEIVETAYPGVWTIIHRNSHGQVVGKFIEITRCPDILCSQAPDIVAGGARLDEALAVLSEQPTGDTA